MPKPSTNLFFQEEKKEEPKSTTNIFFQGEYNKPKLNLDFLDNKNEEITSKQKPNSFFLEDDNSSKPKTNLDFLNDKDEQPPLTKNTNLFFGEENNNPSSFNVGTDNSTQIKLNFLTDNNENKKKDEPKKLKFLFEDDD